MSEWRKDDLFNFLEEKTALYNQPSFIESDPISIPHRFSKKEDIEIAGFFAAIIAWGQRKTILKNASRLMEWMDNAPHDFILNFKDEDLKPFTQFVHRTFNGDDCLAFLHALQGIYREQGGLENAFYSSFKNTEAQPAAGLANFKNLFFSYEHLPRSEKHISNPLKGSAAKRLNMYLRWMVRSDNKGVDFGIWKKLSPSHLFIPLDVHSGNVSRKLGLLKRTQNDWRAVTELTEKLKEFDGKDPVKYDFALFGLGVFEKF